MPDAFGNIDAEGQDEGTSNVTNFEVNPHGINYTMAAWLYSICKAWDLVPYARERYNEYSNNEKSWAKDVEAGARATNPYHYMYTTSCALAVAAYNSV